MKLCCALGSIHLEAMDRLFRHLQTRRTKCIYFLIIDLSENDLNEFENNVVKWKKKAEKKRFRAVNPAEPLHIGLSITQVDIRPQTARKVLVAKIWNTFGRKMASGHASQNRVSTRGDHVRKVSL